ncbi:MAG: single-stranded-DNA-specific exonuclease RecJ [Bacteroidales bacterium]|nr:single-stranded-DNA-specific exonuclease RecJ [Bacteroidales bacterium]MDY3912597.1 single-stranded-DNA-specific exonuclease RecJ [Sodaliphilus sp.]
MISKWNVLPITSSNQDAEARLAGMFPKSPAIARLLVLRGITTREEVNRFFSPSLSQLPDPFLMRDMEKAVGRLNRALGAKEKVMVYGDYDVDGTTAVALVYRYLQNFYSNLVYYVPTRDDEGYGISKQSIDYAASIGVKLIIVLDCGIKAVDEIAYAKTKGIDFIVCDHHVPDEVLPDAAAILNPKLKDDKYPYKDLSGCGVGFKFMQAFSKSNGIGDLYGLDSLLDLLVVSIAADIVPITGENRVLAYYGLKRLNANPSVGLHSIIRLCGLSNREITISDIIFKIGPRINASGRMQSGLESVELLVTKDPSEAYEISKTIDQYNKDRKELDRQITEEANTIIEDHIQHIKDKRPIVIYNRQWHKGIIGIVASRIAELYFRPSVVLTYADEGIVIGSSRSVRGFDIYSAIKSTRGLLETFGGHTNAVGLSLKEENIDEFRRRLEQYVEQHITLDQVTPQIDVDCELGFGEINSDFLKYLRQFNPSGPGNQKPVFVTRGVYDFGTSKLVGRNQEHIKFELVDSKSDNIMNGIAFNMHQYFDYVKQHKPFDICYTIEENKHRNSSSVQLQIKGIRIPADD